MEASHNPMHIELPLTVKVWGDFACFTRPETKVERVSYDVMTPSAARAVLEAIFWKPQFDWVVQEIRVLNPIKRTSLLRNEVISKAAPSTIRRWAEGEDGHFIAAEDRTQRHALILRDVAYVIAADVRIRPGAGPEANPQKYREQFLRRVKRGQCAWTPYLGCREFSAFFGPATPEDVPIPETNALGRMLFDLTYDDSLDKTSRPDRVVFGKTFGEGRPHFFNAQLRGGVLRVPTELYDVTLHDKRSR